MSSGNDKKKVDATTDTTQERSILSGLKGVDRFDDRIDTRPEISNAAALKIIWRGVKLLRHARVLFISKSILAFGRLIPILFLSWFVKIVTDHVILQNELVADEARFPPHMKPLISFLEGRGSMEIMLVLTTIYAIGLILIGTRGSETGTNAGTFGGGAENSLSEGFSSVSGLWGLVEYWVSVRLTQRIDNVLRTRLFGRLTHVPMTTIDDQPVGDSLYRVINDSTLVAGISYGATLYPFFTILGAAIGLYQLQYTYGDVAPLLIWVAWTMLPIIFLVTYPVSRLMRRAHQNARAAGAATTNATEETLNNIGAVQSLGGMKQEKERFAERSAHAFWRGRITLVVNVIYLAIQQGATAIIGVFIVVYVSNQVMQEVLTPGDFFALFTIYIGIAGEAAAIGDFWINLQDRVAPTRRVMFFLDYESDEERYRGEVLDTIERGVTLENVDYAYPDGRQALRNINLDLAVGQVVAFVGPTGAGKTSLAYLIPAFLRPTRGRVLVDGHDIEDVSLDSLRDQVSYVFQEHLLLPESIRDNLLLAKPEASAVQLMKALETAGCLEFIEKLPDGIDTVLGRSGDTLSVGQQQRLSIARGLIRETKVLILDEPTAALDPQTENALVQALHEASKDRLVIIIAHRLSTIRQADRIIFLYEGEVKDVGDHESLMADPDSPYRRFVELQGG